MVLGTLGIRCPSGSLVDISANPWVVSGELATEMDSSFGCGVAGIGKYGTDLSSPILDPP